MKTFLSIALTLLYSILCVAQNGINYKAVIKNNLGNVVANQSVTIQFSILTGVSQTTVYQETHEPTTDANGIAIVNIGEGLPITGTYMGIVWGSDTHYLNVKVNTGSGLVDMGTTQFMAVPYALSAKNVEGGVKKLGDLTDAKSDVNGSSLFIGKNAGLNDGSNNNENVGVGNSALRSNTTGLYNTANGVRALGQNTTGSSNTANGNVALGKNTTGSYNTANGVIALYSNTTGNNNTAVGNASLYSNITGNNNTAGGYQALFSNTTGSQNIANGLETLYSNTTGNNNTAIGYKTLHSNTTGDNHTASGFRALYSNTTGDNNTANGYQALYLNTTGSYNTANGLEALYSNTTGNYNTANGYQALRSNRTGINNTSNGFQSLRFNTTGFGNVANGYQALQANVNGNVNTAIGWNALLENIDGGANTAIGKDALKNSTADFNTALGVGAGDNITTGQNNTAVGQGAQVPNKIGLGQVRIGNAYVRYAGVQVGWSTSSDRRLKSNIQSSNLGLDFIKALKPVVYERNNEPNKKTEYGLIAQEVETALNKFGAINNGLITIDDEGMYSLRYNDLITVLIKAVQEQETTINQQSQLLNQVTTRLEKLESKKTN